MPVNLRTRKSLALLAYLAVKNREVRRSELDALLWPEQAQHNARRSLRDELSRINHVLDYEIIISNQQEVSLTRHGLEVDLWQLEQMLGAGRFTEAVELYRGVLLEGFHVRDAAPFESWLEAERGKVQEKIVDALGKLYRLEETRGDHTEALRYARCMIEIEPLDEEAYVLAMRSAALFGDRVGALRLYRDLVLTLSEELQIEPSPEVRAFADRIERGWEEVAHKPEVSFNPLPNAATDSGETGPVRFKTRTIRHNLPAATTTFVGRRRELEIITSHLRQQECRHLTIVGMGGIGKTRLAREAAAQLLTSYRDGVWFVPMVSASTLDFLFFAVAKAIEFSFDEDSSSREQLVAYLEDKEILFVLDGLEHLTSDVEPFRTLLNAAPEIRILATSRRRLGLSGEYVLDLKGMRFPEGGDATSDTPYEAIDLFVERARRVNPAVVFSSGDERLIQRICQMMAGVPLAIELAAALVRTLSCVEIIDAIEEKIDNLDSNLIDLPQRHRGLRTVLEETWNNLSSEQQRVFSALSVLRGHFSREEAYEIAGADLKMLSSLVECSLLRRYASDNFQLLEVMRRYAWEKLNTLRETKQEVVAAHLDYYSLEREGA
ncbi:MAG: AAA family ATPase [Trueperaceae bacterium]|nr:MAG: AAA family ATPase [Trueperaceae bacterium]